MAAATADTPTPNDDAALAKYWLAEIDTAEKDKKRKRWLDRCKAIIRLYEEEKPEAPETASLLGAKRFALFWSNIEVLKPATLARTPEPLAMRRFKDSDPVGRQACEILERALKFTCEAYDFESVLFGARDDYLLLARAQAWVRYVPHIKTKDGEAKSTEPADGGEAYEVVDWEEVVSDRVDYRDYLHSVARQWAEVWWNGRIVYLTRKECVARFGEEIGNKITLDYAPPDQPDATDELKKARIYEIWDKTTKRALWFSKAMTDRPLDVRDDPLKLKDFFPCPRPAFGTLAPGSTVPTPDYIYYQTQCEEIDVLTDRIGQLIEALKVRGFYSAAEGTDLNTLLSSANNTLIPVDSWAALGDKGGLKGLIEWFPIEQVAAAIKECIATRKEIISDVYQVTGISDIQRGDTDPEETAAAQQLKASFGSSRVHERKKEMARFARDILSLKAEVIATQFSAETLGQMTDVTLLTTQERDEIQAQMQAAQQAQQLASAPPQPGAPPAPPPAMPPPPDPKKVALLGKPTWEDVMGILRSPSLRAYRIDIETDSTIEPNDQEEKMRRIEFVEAVGKFIAEALPVVQAMPQMQPVIAQALLFLVRGFRVGREMEDVIEEALDKIGQAAAPQGQQGPDPQAEQAKAQAAVMQAQAAQGKVQTEQQANQIEAAKMQSQHQLEGARIQSDHAIGMAQVAAENARTHAQSTTDAHGHIVDVITKAADRQATKEINATKPIRADTP
jgi:hypothetical protein